MSDDLAEEPSGDGVSPTRKKLSVAILIVLVAVLLIEMRAGLGHRMSGAALQTAAPEGVFEPNRYSHADVKGMLTLWPTETLLRTGRDETEYQYSWFSILRPVLSPLMPPGNAISATNLFVSVSNRQPSAAIRFGTEGPSAAELEAARNPPIASEDPEDTAGMPGMGERPRRGPRGSEDGPSAAGDPSNGGAAAVRPALDEAPATDDAIPANQTGAEETPQE